MTVSSHSVIAYANGVEIPIIDASVTLDEGWAPYAATQLTTPLNVDVLELLDPRNKARVQVYMRQDFGTSQKLSTLTSLFGSGHVSAVTTAWHLYFLFQISARYYTPFNSFGVRPPTVLNLDLTVRERVANYENSTLSITLASDEALLQDYALVSTAIFNPGNTSVRAITEYVLTLIGTSLATGTADGTVEADSTEWLPGQTAWDYLSPLVQSAGLRLYCDEQRDWHLIDDTFVAPGQTILTYTGTLVDASDTISRDTTEWYDAVVITYTWTDALGATQYAYDTASEIGFSKVLHIEYDTAYPGAGAAARILTRASGRGLVNELSAVSDYSARPSQPTVVSLPEVITQTGFLSQLTWTFPDDTMSVKTRGLVETPDTAWVFTPVGRHWNDIAAGIHWNTYTA